MPNDYGGETHVEEYDRMEDDASERASNDGPADGPDEWDDFDAHYPPAQRVKENSSA